MLPKLTSIKGAVPKHRWFKFVAGERPTQCDNILISVLTVHCLFWGSLEHPYSSFYQEKCKNTIQIGAKIVWCDGWQVADTHLAELYRQSGDRVESLTNSKYQWLVSTCTQYNMRMFAKKQRSIGQDLNKIWFFSSQNIFLRFLFPNYL